MNVIRKQYISLIELLVALSLTVIVLMTLTFFYRQVTEIEIEINRTNTDNFNSRYIESRLSSILPKAVAANKNDFLFFSVGDEGLTKPGSKSLIFTFDNNVSLDKAFSNHVLARLYLDKNGNLMLVYWPSPARWETNVIPPMKKELLFQGVDNLSFEYYIAPGKRKKEPAQEQEEKKANDKNAPPKNEKKETLEPEPKGEWRRLDWLEEYNQLPVMVKIILTLPKGQEPLVFIYPLANAKTHVVYE